MENRENKICSIPNCLANLEPFHEHKSATKFRRYTANVVAHVGTVFHIYVRV
jgi:hypothetical protein